jgi:hypothetical protein
MDYIKQAALNAGIEVIDYSLEFSPALSKSHSDITHIVCHHDVWPGGTMKDIHRDHKMNNGYRGAGYHARFPAGGGIELGRSYGMIGGHCKQDKMNYRSIGLVWEGNLDVTNMTAEQFKDSTKFLAEYLKLTGQELDKVLPHNHFANKSCPGKNFPMLKIKRRVQEILDQEGDKAAPWAEEAQKFVMSKMVDNLPLSDGTRPYEQMTRQEQWVMLERFYKVMINEFKKMIEEEKQC